jgi:translation initiation factor eIF-2B subunit delta/methylthioribose-1-phosphate isomerase
LVKGSERSSRTVTLEKRIELIREDTNHGAGWLARQAVEALAEAVEQGADPLETGRRLAGARPAMGAIAGAVGRVLAGARTPEQLVEEASALIASRDRAAHSIAVLLSDEIKGIVMTHSASATVREALVHARPQRVVCTASDPQGEGRPFAEDLTSEGLTVEVVADDDAPHAVKSVQVLLLGADIVFRDGSLVNKAGTSDLAKAAQAAGVPVLVACETFKLAPVDPQDPGEDSFDLTPGESVDRYVTEEGAYASSEIGVLVDQTPFLRAGYELLRG